MNSQPLLSTVHFPRQPRHERLSTAILATIPLLLAAVTVWMVRGALSQDDRRESGTPAVISSPAPNQAPTR